MEEYPNKCTRCGMCCIQETCPDSMRLHGISKSTLCPELSIRDNIATCKLVTGDKIIADLMGIGAGCCIKARARVAISGEFVDFSSLSKEKKQNIVNLVRFQ